MYSACVGLVEVTIDAALPKTAQGKRTNGVRLSGRRPGIPLPIPIPKLCESLVQDATADLPDCESP